MLTTHRSEFRRGKRNYEPGCRSLILRIRNRPSFSLLAYAFIPLLLTACSGNSGGGGASSYNDAFDAYKGSAAQRTAQVAETIAAAYVERLASGSSSDEAFYKQFEDEIAGLTDYLCGQIKDLQGKVGSGKEKAQRLDDLRVTSEDILRDEFIRALMRKVLAAPPEQREQLLGTMGVKAMGAGGAQVQGTAALQYVGLLDSQGQISIPPRGTDQYVRYERWLSNETPGFAGINSKLMGNAKTEIERCSSSA